MTGLGWCGLCGAVLDELGARRCGCAPLSELAIVTSRAVILAGRSSAKLDVHHMRRAMEIAAAERRRQR